MKLRSRLLAVTAAVVASALFAVAVSDAADRNAGTAAVLPAKPAVSSALAVRCERPAKLRLVRFEDSSAQLFCGRRLLVRVSVPG
jgi:hypothetical protein